MGSVYIDRPLRMKQSTTPSLTTRHKKLGSIGDLTGWESEDAAFSPSKLTLEHTNVTHMTQTDFWKGRELSTEKPSEHSGLWTRKRLRVPHISNTHQRTLSLPEETSVNFVLTPTKSIPPIFRVPPVVETRIWGGVEHVPNRLLTGMCYSVRGSGFRQKLPKAKLVQSAGGRLISLKEKLHTVVQGRKAVLNGSVKARRKSVMEAMTFTD